MNASHFFSCGLAATMLLSAAMPALADSYADDRAKIENLQARYMFAMDWRDADTYASCFTEDGELDWARGVEKGRKAIRAAVEGMRAGDQKRAAEDKLKRRPGSMRHNITNIVIKIDGNKATGRAYWTEFNNLNDRGVAVVGGYGHYEDELVKINGEWFFTKRKIFNEILDSRAAPAKSPAW